MIDVLMTGPLRPSLDYVLFLCEQLRTHIPECRIHIGYWKTTDEDHTRLTDVFDSAHAFDEPSDDLIYKLVHARTIQQRQLQTIKHWTLSMFKMFYGVHRLLDTLQLPDDTPVMRIRTDIYLKTMDICPTISPSTFYMRPRVSGGNSDDWFGISDAKTMQLVYGMKSMIEYNTTIGHVFNAEHVILYRAQQHGIRIVSIQDRVDLAICRAYINNVPTLHEYP